MSHNDYLAVIMMTFGASAAAFFAFERKKLPLLLMLLGAFALSLALLYFGMATTTPYRHHVGRLNISAYAGMSGIAMCAALLTGIVIAWVMKWTGRPLVAALLAGLIVLAWGLRYGNF